MIILRYKQSESAPRWRDSVSTLLDLGMSCFRHADYSTSLPSTPEKTQVAPELWSLRLFAARNSVCLSPLPTSPSDYKENVGRRERTWIQTPRLLAFSSFQRAVYTCIWQHTTKQHNKYLPHRLSLPESLMEHDGLSHWRWDNQHKPQSLSITPYLNILLKKAL